MSIIYSSSREQLISNMARPCARKLVINTIRACICISLLGLCTYYGLRSTVGEKSRIYDRQQDGDLLALVEVSDEAEALPKKGRILCWSLTSEKYHDTRAQAINETWLSRCDHGVFFTNAPFKKEKRMPYRTVFAGIPDSYGNLFFKSRYALYYIAELLRVDFDWYVKADDDVYIIMENLRAYLDTLDPSQPYYIGHRMKPHLAKGYNSGGGGYVLSRKALEMFARQAYDDAELCPDDNNEDVGIGRCLANIGIFPHPTINEHGQQRFNAYHPRLTLDGWKASVNWIYDPLLTFQWKKNVIRWYQNGDWETSTHHLTSRN